MGVTGAGKSTFINYLSEFDVEVGHNMESCTNKVAVYPVTLPNGTNIFLLDTPGFDDTYKSDTDVLREIAAWLQDAHAHKVLLSGLVYLHRIQDVRFTGAAMKNLRMFKKLCGHEGLKNVVLATTFWNKVTAEEGDSREAQLRTGKEFWKSMVDEGSQMIRQDDEATSALHIIERLVQKKTTIELAIQREMRGGMTLDQTGAGKEVEAQVERMRIQWQKEKKDLEADMREALAAHDKEAQRQIKLEREEIDKKILESDRSMKRLQATNSQLAEQLHSQRQEMSNKMLLLNHLENREEKREKKFYRKYNPLHKRYDEM
ncbi:hypothetical protein LTR86_009770 [Recurvomyces mirabilis]|nr:hypothetical protein LTR86_009770 [Recurvomyces mirabilis]